MKNKITFLIIALSFCLNILFLLFYGKDVYSKTKSALKTVLSTQYKNNNELLNTLAYHNGLEFLILGKYHSELNYNRLPANNENIVRPIVWSISKSSSGISIKFRTNSPIIGAKWKLTRNPNLPNMTKVGVSGIDLYCFVNAKWQYVNSGIPKGINNESLLISHMDTLYKDFLINLPLNDGIESFEIGINKDFKIVRKMENDIEEAKPIVFYGTQTIQGAGASRPGMAYPSIISRNLNIETINLGISGHGGFEQSISRVLCEIDTELMVLDCTENSYPDTIKNNALKLIQQIRKCKPKTPILLIESVIREYSHFSKTDVTSFGNLKFKQPQNNELRNSYVTAIDKGITDIYYLEAEGLKGFDHEASVDGRHLTDLGHYRMANKVQDKIVEILKIK